MKSDYQYSSQIVYKNFPWPSATAEQHDRVEEMAQAVLAAREPHLPPRGMATLADLYGPLTMPPDLQRVHSDLDRAVEKCYRREAFSSDRERLSVPKGHGTHGRNLTLGAKSFLVELAFANNSRIDSDT
jgi:hypothetical protein